jgi:hypothetical protein
MKHTTRFLMFVSFTLLVGPAAVRADWQVNGNPLTTAVGSQWDPAIIPDGVDGAIVTWWDERNGFLQADIYAQRIDSHGQLLWSTSGVALCTATGDQVGPQIVSDGVGGAIVTWVDDRVSSLQERIYAQRIDNTGKALWEKDGVLVCSAPDQKGRPVIASDGAGGAIICWQDYRGGIGISDIYVQRMHGDGKRAWTSNGVALCTAANYQNYPEITSDGVGGAVVVWEDARAGLSNIDIFANRIDASGNLWLYDGIGVCFASGNQVKPQLVSNGAGGAIITWVDARSGNNDIYIRGITSFGAPQFPLDGLGICTASGDQLAPSIASDGAGGAIVAWQDGRSAAQSDIYAQRVDAGAVVWTSDGIAVCTATADQTQPKIVPDGANGGLIVWADGRAGLPDIYAGRITALGGVPWGAGGVALSTAIGEQSTPVIVSDNTGGSIAAWGFDGPYAQRLSANGEWGYPEPTITSIVDVPADQGKSVTVRWHEGDKTSQWYYYEVERNDSGIWNFVGAQGDNGGSTYSLTVPTLDDSTCWLPFGQQFRVNAWGLFLDPDRSVPATGLSRDNIAPPPPVLSMQRVGGTVTLHWTPSPAADILFYTVYLSLTPGQPGTSYFSETGDTTFTADFGPPFADQYWSVAAWDQHCNRGAPSNEVAFLLPNTPVGTNVGVSPYDDGGSGTQPAGITFSNVTGEGRTSLNITPTGQSLPGSFTPGDSKYYNITTTATWTGSIQVCIQYDESALAVPEATLRMLHYDTALMPPAWVDITTILDTVNNVICGVTNHLSPFVIGAGSVTGVGDRVPLAFALHPNVPNPFNPATTITYDIPSGGADVNIAIYDVAGRLVRQLVDEHRAAGTWSLQWNGEDGRGQRVASGVYFYRMRAGSFLETRKMVLLK